MLYTCGCSFTYGEELQDLTKAWPHVLGKLLNKKTINTATCSASNDYIKRNVVNYVLQNTNNLKDLFIAVGWTSDIRWEGFIDTPIIGYVQHKLNPTRGVRYTHPTEYRIYKDQELLDLIPQYIKTRYDKISIDFIVAFLSNTIYNSYIKKQHILLTHLFLKQYGVKHLFFNSITESTIHKNKIVQKEYLQLFKEHTIIDNEIQSIKNYIHIPTMEDFTKAYPLAKLDKHPLDAGHNAWAKYLYDYIKEYDLL